MQEHASKAQIARNKMKRASAQAKALALRSINGYDPEDEEISISVKAEPSVVRTYSQTIPQYSYEIGAVPAGGYIDEMQTQINNLLLDDNLSDFNIAIDESDME